ncbi:predicted protein [Plenodomus lingam JN3]|uniref:Predicted protein n=1 Tax=Leptosphaeria maculans (strain JN3 / isolate v23.1.3 / race Av1-4-5-6-7-8) TaxID=985895 RepID=E5A4J2_LEPMJ|nr:predicted protein [Plenodomus lingam JN3]CBX98540.1 predicted protein [Plenodomus lingam JN3]
MPVTTVCIPESSAVLRSPVPASPIVLRSDTKLIPR